MGQSVFNKQDAQQVNNVVEKIKIAFQKFTNGSLIPTNKAGAKRARKNTVALEKLMKEYRKISIKSNQVKEE